MLLDNCTFNKHPTIGARREFSQASAIWPVIRIAGTLEFVCPLGYWMPNTGDYSGANFTGCAYQCDAGNYGDQTNHTNGFCAGPCPMKRATSLPGAGSVSQCVCASSERLRQLAVWLAAGGQRAGWRSNPPCAH